MGYRTGAWPQCDRARLDSPGPVLHTAGERAGRPSARIGRGLPLPRLIRRKARNCRFVLDTCVLGGIRRTPSLAL